MEVVARSGRVYLWGVEGVGGCTSGEWREWEGVPLGGGSGGEEWEGVPLGGGSGGEEWEGVPLGGGSGGEEWEGVPLGGGSGGEEWEGVPLGGGGGGEESEGVPLGGGGGGEESEGVPLGHLLRTLNLECSVLCRKRKPVSLFRKIPVNKLAEFKWAEMIAELEHDAPLLLKILHCMVAKNNSRNKCKVGAARYPGICTAVSVVLKERNREMCGLQSCLSVLMYSCHCEKQVTQNNVLKLEKGMVGSNRKIHRNHAP